jgi:hypothetical protein
MMSSYRPFLSPKAEQEFLKFPKYLQEALAAFIQNELCDSPSKHSHSACYPYFPEGHVAHLTCTRKDKEIRVSIHFKFSQDERTLEIAYFGWIQLGNEPGPASLDP